MFILQLKNLVMIDFIKINYLNEFSLVIDDV